MHDGQATISPEVLARYASDAAGEVDGVRGLSGRSAVKVDEHAFEVHLVVEWGVSIPAVGTAVRERVRDYLARMARVADAEVTVVVDEIGAP
jgi:uncharacterized alkaline shock family protein YloU